MGYLGPQHCQGQRKGRRTGTAAGLEQVLNECEPLPVLLQLDVRGSVFDLGSGTSALAQLVARLMAPQPTHLRFGWLSESASHLKLWARQRRLEPKQQVPVEFVHGVYTGLLSTLMRHLQPRAHSLLELDMSGCHFAGPEVEPVLRHLRSVTQLRLNQVGHCNFTNGLPLPDPSSVAQIPSRRLHTLNLRGFGLVEDAHVRPVLQNNPQLRRLNLSLTCVSDNLLLAIPALCPGLEMLDVDYCVGMHAKTLADSASQLPQLTMLSCSELLGLDDAVVAAMLRRGSPGWVRVGFGSSASISDGALASVARLCPRLEALYIPNLPCITATGLQQLLRSCSQLKHLCVDCCAGLADGFVQRLHKDLPFVFEGEQH